VAVSHPIRGVRLLLVEDDTSIRTTLAELLREEGLLITAVANGREALHELRTSAPPDVVLLDLMMPLMDGWEFRVEQRNDPLLASIPIIAMSANMSAKARAIAADAYIRKPIEFGDLLRQIGLVVENANRQRLAAADRMAALGTLAAGISHEINNPLTYVMANLQRLAEKLRPTAPVATAGADPEQLTKEDPRIDANDLAEMRELVADAYEGAERIRKIVKQTQMVAPVERERRPSTIGLRAVLDAALDLTENQIRHRARLTRELNGDPRVTGDRGALEQLFVNLLLNAIQAIPEGRVAENEIRVSLRELPSNRAMVEIADTGPGIPAAIQERIFQPFFTTKPVGQGTGLGLAICKGIVTALGGEITFSTEPGAGTTFRVTLPATTAPLEEPLRSARRLVAGVPLRPRILAVDNEPSILRVIRQFLEPGYEVTTVNSAAEAVALIRAGRRFDLVLCALMLPGQTGMDLLDELERSRSKLADRVTFMTAGAFTPRARRFLEATRRPWLSKPFNRDQLITFVTDLVQAQREPAKEGVPLLYHPNDSGAVVG
jgi:signal transduction histidine kinase